MEIGDRVTLEWRRFAELPADLLYEVLRFRQAIFVVEQASPYPDLDGLDQQALHLLLRDGGTLAGGLRLIPFGAEKRVAIGRVAVGAKWRGRGVARHLMAEALARCAADFRGWQVTLGAQTYLAQFYQSLGFQAAGAPYDDYGVPHIEMTLRTCA